MHRFFAGLAATAALFFATNSSSAAIIITEVQPSGSDSSYGGDWFELTNTDAAAVDISGWRIDDNSNSFASSTALTGVTSIAGGQSVVFLGGTNTTGFLTAWFGSSVPSGFTIGTYTPNGLGQGGDAVNIYDGSGSLMANIIYGSATPAISFDNAAGVSGTISTQSIFGVNGAFNSVADFSVTNPIKEIGSPGFAPSAIPEPSTWALMLCGIGGFGLVARRRARG